jgi:hypothetical protein
VHGTTCCRLRRKAVSTRRNVCSLLRPELAAKETVLKIIYRRCAGIDVHEKSVSVCARIVKGKNVEILEATFGAFTEDLEELKAWLLRLRIKRVAMESTGVYWRPVWNILERAPGKLELLLLNPQQVKALPGHKTIVWTRAGLPSCSSTARCRCNTGSRRLWRTGLAACRRQQSAVAPSPDLLRARTKRCRNRDVTAPDPRFSCRARRSPRGAHPTVQLSGERSTRSIPALRCL